MSAPRGRRWGILLSPLVLIAAGHLVEKAAGPTLGAWSWIPAMVVFWALIAAVIAWGRTSSPIQGWLGPARGSWVWSLLAVLVGLGSVRELLSDWRVLASPAIVSLWLVFGLVNAWFEESYWRGLLIDAAEGWKGLAVLYSAALFALSHPLIWGVHSVALRHPAALVGLGLVGLVWGLAYWRTGSLRWTIVGHSCANLLGLSVPVLLNLHVPAGLK